jgi:outer membrane protein OmpA-like peptidoglycan-associated protein
MSIDEKAEGSTRRRMGFFGRVGAAITAIALGITTAYGGCIRPDYDSTGATDARHTPTMMVPFDPIDAGIYTQPADADTGDIPVPTIPADAGTPDAAGTTRPDANTSSDATPSPADASTITRAGGMTPSPAITHTPSPTTPSTPPTACIGETRVEFHYNSTRLVNATAMQDLERFMRDAAAAGHRTIYVAGFASIEGPNDRASPLNNDDPYNIGLGLRRANAVGERLQRYADRNHLDVRVRSHSFGETAVLGTRYEPNRMAVISTRPLADPETDTSIAATLTRHAAGELYNVPCSIANTATPAAPSTTPAVAPSAAPDTSAPAHTASPAHTHAPRRHAPARAPAPTPPPYTTDTTPDGEGRVTMPNGAVIITPNLEPSAPAAPDAGPAAAPAVPAASAPAAPAPDIGITTDLEKRLDSLEKMARSDLTKTGNYVGLIFKITDECPSNGSGKSLCRPDLRNQYATDCGKGSPRIPAHPGDKTVCQTVTEDVSAKIGSLRKDISSLDNQAAALGTDIAKAYPAGKSNARLEKVRSLITSLDEITRKGQDMLSKYIRSSAALNPAEPPFPPEPAVPPAAAPANPEPAAQEYAPNTEILDKIPAPTSYLKATDDSGSGYAERADSASCDAYSKATTESADSYMNAVEKNKDDARLKKALEKSKEGAEFIKALDETVRKLTEDRSSYNRYDLYNPATREARQEGVFAAYTSGTSVREIAKMYGISKSTAYADIRKQRQLENMLAA